MVHDPYRWVQWFAECRKKNNRACFSNRYEGADGWITYYETLAEQQAALNLRRNARLMIQPGQNQQKSG